MEPILIAVLAFLVGCLATARVRAWLSRPERTERTDDAHRVAELETRLQAVEYAFRGIRPMLPPPPPGRRW
ncbi:hypothetical protein ACWED2_34025 [Amycolatopsis sp. NPDC005003]